MQAGDIVLVSVPQTDGDYKLRPALLLKHLPKYDDFLVCGISSQLHQHVEGIDEILKEEDFYFSQTGLRITSIIRLLYLAVVPTNRIIGSIGNIPVGLYQQLLRRLSRFITSE